MLELQKTYGKTIHTWPVDISPDFPLGPPKLMAAYTADGQGPPTGMVRSRDERSGQDTAVKGEFRKSYLPSYQVADGADEPLTSRITFAVNQKR